MHCDMLNGGQGLVPYADPDCKSENGRQKETELQRGWHGPDILILASRQPPPALPSAPPPGGAMLSGTCVEPGHFIKGCFFSSRLKDLNELSSWPFWAPAFFSLKWVCRPHPHHHLKSAIALSVFPPLSSTLSFFPPLVFSPCSWGDKPLLRHTAAHRHAKVV